MTSEWHLARELQAAERELDRRAGIISIQADMIAKLTRERDALKGRQRPPLRVWSARDGWHTVVTDDEPGDLRWRAA